MIKPALITLITFFVFPIHAFAFTIFTVKTEHTTYYCNHEDYWEYDTRLWITPGNEILFYQGSTNTYCSTLMLIRWSYA